MDAATDNEGYARFRQALRDGRLTPGMTLTQADLCELLGMSLSPLRETLVLLEEYGLVEIRPRAGVSIIYPDIAFIRENYQFRILIEVHALKSFVPQATPEWLAGMRARHEQLRQDLSGDLPFDIVRARTGALDVQMHGDFVRALDNRAILLMHDRLQENLTLARHVHQRVFFPSHYLDSLVEHGRILDALERRDDTGAVAELEAHFRASTHRTFGG